MIRNLKTFAKNLRDLYLSISQEKLFFLAAFIIFTAGLVLRINIINAQDVVALETLTIVDLVDKSTILKIIEADSSIPPFQYLVMRFVSWFSTDKFWLRAPNLVCFAATFLIITEITKKVSKRAALIALLLFSFSNYQLEQGWEAYVYAMFQFWGAVSIYSLFKLSQKGNLAKTFWSIIFVIANLSGWFTHYSFIWYLMAVAFYFALLFFKKEILKKSVPIDPKRPLTLLSITFFFWALYLPTFLSIYEKANLLIDWFDPPKITQIGHGFLSSIGLFHIFGESYFDQEGAGIIGIIAAGLFIILSLIKSKKKSFSLIKDLNLLLILFYLFIAYAFSLVIGESIIVKRTLVILSVTMTIMLALMLDQALRKSVIHKIVAAAALIYLMVFYVDNFEYYHRHINSEQVSAKRISQIAKKKDVKTILFLDAGMQPFIVEDYINLLFDYYWYGYDGSEKKAAYELIRKESFKDFYKKEEYWMVGIRDTYNADETVISKYCHNASQEDILEGEGMIMKCNPE